MRNITRSIIIALVGSVVAVSNVFSQAVEIDYIELQGRSVVVHYNVDDGANSTRQFLVQLFSSQDNFTTPLTRVSGDIGTEVTAGFDKKIVWDITKELTAFKGDVSLELRGRVYVPFVKIQSISAAQVFKRGKNYPLNWASGNLSGQVNIELFNENDERIWGESNVSNVGKYDWYIPSGVKKGKNYRLKFTNARDRNDVVYSNPFTIRPRIPLIAKIGAVLVVGAAVEFLLLNKNNGKESSSDHTPYSTPEGPPQ